MTKPRTIALTGGSSGIGAAVIDRLHAAGCLIFNLDRVPSTRPGVMELDCDISKPHTIDAAITQLPDELDALISVAGVAPGIVDDETLIAINFLGMRHLIEGVLPRIIDKGSVVIVASSAGRDWRDEPRVQDLLDTGDFDDGSAWVRENADAGQANAYKFSKQCAAAYTYRAAGIGRDRSVRFNCVNPGIVETALSPHFQNMLGADRYDRIIAASKRAGTPQDVAEVIEYLAIGHCQWLNGVELTVDGGYYAGIVGGWIEA